MTDSAVNTPTANTIVRADISAAARRMIASGRFGLSIASKELDAPLWGAAVMAEAVKQFLLFNRSATLRILLAPRESGHGQHHALIELAQVLTSRILIRETQPGQTLPLADLLLVDGRTYLERQHLQDLESKQWLNDFATAREKQRQFNSLWEHALPAARYRRLGL